MMNILSYEVSTERGHGHIIPGQGHFSRHRHATAV